MAYGDDIKPGKDSSPATLDPWLALACGVLAEAIADLRSSDPIVSLDSLCWWLDEAPIWLAAVEAELAPEQVFYLVLTTTKGKHYVEKSAPKLALV